MSINRGRVAFFALVILGNALCQTNWTLRNSGTIKTLYSVLWAGNQLVAVGDGSTIVTSPDGVNWTVRYGGTTRTLYTVAWTGERYAATGNDSMRFSANGITWSAQLGGGMNSLIWDGNQFMGVAPAVGIIASPDGLNWHRKASSMYDPLSLAWSGQHYVVVGPHGEVNTSSNGNSWTILFVGGSTIRSITWTGRKFIAVADGGSLISPDGINWEVYRWNTWLNAVSWAGNPAGGGPGQLIGVGDFGTIRTSPDGITWTTRNSGTPYALYSVTWTGNLFVAVGQNGVILTSPLDPSSIAPRLPRQEFITLRFTPSHLFAFSQPHLGRSVRAAIFSMNGSKLVETNRQDSKNEFALPLNGIPSGAYVLKVSSHGGDVAQVFRR